MARALYWLFYSIYSKVILNFTVNKHMAWVLYWLIYSKVIQNFTVNGCMHMARSFIAMSVVQFVVMAGEEAAVTGIFLLLQVFNMS